MLIYFSSRSANFSTGCEIGTIVLMVKDIRALDRGEGPDLASLILEMLANVAYISSLAKKCQCSLSNF